ncbi:MAG: T9SS type A sorting domain-containing protein, partial [Pricia sp.]
GLPPSLEAVGGVDFDGAGAGTCLIWHLRFEDGLQGAEMGLNANDLVGCYDLSNPIEVVRKEAVSEEVSVTVFPMPATDVLNIALKDFRSREVQVGLFDVTGNAIKNSMNAVENNSVSLNVQTVPAGLYLLKVSDASGKSITKKVVIQ